MFSGNTLVPSFIGRPNLIDLAKCLPYSDAAEMGSITTS